MCPLFCTGYSGTHIGYNLYSLLHGSTDGKEASCNARWISRFWKECHHCREVALPAWFICSNECSIQFLHYFRNVTKSTWETIGEKSWQKLWTTRQQNNGLLYRRYEYAWGRCIWNRTASYVNQTVLGLWALVCAFIYVQFLYTYALWLCSSLRTLNSKSTVFWDVMLFSLVDWCFGET